MRKTLAIDFDGVIHKYSKGYQEGDAYDVPMEGAGDALRKLLDQGCDIILHTTRDEATLFEWFIRHLPQFVTHPEIDQSSTASDIVQHEWIKGITYVQKPRAHFYIDDRALRFTSWHDITRYIL